KDKTTKHFSQGRLTSVVDTHGVTRSYAYDGAGRLQSVTAPDGGVTTLAYNGPGGTLSSITEPGGRVLTLSQSSGGDLLGIVDVDSSTRQFTYASGHRLTQDAWQPYSAFFNYDDTTGLVTGV